VEEEVGIVLDSSTGGAMLVDVVGVPGSSVGSGEGMSNESPCECFDDGWKSLGFPDAKEYLVSLRIDASRALLR